MKPEPLFILFVLITATLILSPSVPLVESTAQPLPQAPARIYEEARTIYLGNLARRQNGVPPLKWNRQLTDAARWFSWDSVENRPAAFCGHQDTRGHWPDWRARAFGYKGGAGAENAFCGYLTPEDAIAGWMDSPPHRDNLLAPGHREIGVGYYRRERDGRGYVTQDFGHDSAYPPVIINNESITTTSPLVDLYIYDREPSGGFAGLGSATEMMISNDPHFDNATWESYAAEKVWPLEPSEGWQTVYVKTRDSLNRTVIASDMIYLGDSAPLEELGTAQMSTTREQVTLYDLDVVQWPSVQFSLNWAADDTFETFELLWGNGERVGDPAAWGGTAFRLLPSNGESHAWVWTTDFIKDMPLIAYVRLKVNDNTSTRTVAQFSAQGGGTEYGPLRLQGTDFTQPNQYQEFPLAFT